MYKNDKESGDELAERLLNFAVKVIQLVKSLPKTEVGRHIGGQLLSSGTSPGSNYEEARGAESRSDFIHKLGIALKEMKESRFWLKLIQSSKLLVDSNSSDSLLKECEELCAIIAKSILTARKNK